MELVTLYKMLSSAHLEVQGMVDTLGDPVLLVDESLCVIRANPAFYRAFQVHEADTVGASLFAIGNGQWNIPELRRLLKEVMPKAQAVIGFEVSHDFPAIGPRTMLVSARRMVREDNNSLNLVLAFRDVTDVRKSAAVNDLLLGEADHRVKNVLAVVHALALQAEVEGKSAREYRDALLGRLEAFISAKDLIAAADNAKIGVSAIVDDALRAVNSDQIVVEPGPSVQLGHAHVRPLRMMLHELTTNALKYGALSSRSGVVHLVWRLIGDESLQLDWQEEGGPTVSPPDHLGFGGTMIKSSARNCGGTADFNFDPGGLHARITIGIKSTP
jgi:two-component sensor histidine kinase